MQSIDRIPRQSNYQGEHNVQRTFASDDQLVRHALRRRQVREARVSHICLGAPLWGLGKEVFHYDNRSLQDAILAEMERSKWIGVCCEPNIVFVVCNQFPIIAMRDNDVRDGTDITSEVLVKYQEAWEKKGMVAPNGLYVDWYYVNQDKLVPPSDICFTAWANAFMNTWNSELIESLYEKQALGYITNVNGQVRLHDHYFAREYRKIVEDSGSEHKEDTAALVDEARALRAINHTKPDELTDPVLGCVLQWLSELGKATELQGLLDYSDASLQPTWERGGLFYPRQDPPYGQGDEWAHMDPFTGNAGIAYGRLNVKNGQKSMWDEPWTRETLAQRPWIDNIDLRQGVDTLRGIWDSENNALVLTVRTWDGKKVVVEPVAKNLEPGAWAVYIDGVLTKQEVVQKPGDLAVTVTVGGDEVDVVFQRMKARL